MNRKFLMAAAGMAAMCAASPAFAQFTTQTNITVFLTVAPSCTINGNAGPGGSGGILNFGNVPNSAAFPTDLDGATDVAGGTPATIVCNTNSNQAAFQVDSGRNDSGGFHQLSDSTNNGPPFLKYKVYTTPARNVEYVVGTPQPVNGGVVAANVPVIVNLYGRILKTDINNAAVPQNGSGGYADVLFAAFKF